MVNLEKSGERYEVYSVDIDPKNGVPLEMIKGNVHIYDVLKSLVQQEKISSERYIYIQECLGNELYKGFRVRFPYARKRFPTSSNKSTQRLFSREENTDQKVVKLKTFNVLSTRFKEISEFIDFIEFESKETVEELCAAFEDNFSYIVIRLIVKLKNNLGDVVENANKYYFSVDKKTSSPEGFNFCRAYRLSKILLKNKQINPFVFEKYIESIGRPLPRKYWELCGKENVVKKAEVVKVSRKAQPRQAKDKKDSLKIAAVNLALQKRKVKEFKKSIGEFVREKSKDLAAQRKQFLAIQRYSSFDSKLQDIKVLNRNVKFLLVICNRWVSKSKDSGIPNDQKCVVKLRCLYNELVEWRDVMEAERLTCEQGIIEEKNESNSAFFFHDEARDQDSENSLFYSSRGIINVFIPIVLVAGVLGLIFLSTYVGEWFGSWLVGAQDNVHMFLGMAGVVGIAVNTATSILHNDFEKKNATNFIWEKAGSRLLGKSESRGFDAFYEIFSNCRRVYGINEGEYINKMLNHAVTRLKSFIVSDLPVKRGLNKMKTFGKFVGRMPNIRIAVIKDKNGSGTYAVDTSSYGIYKSLFKADQKEELLLFNIAGASMLGYPERTSKQNYAYACMVMNEGMDRSYDNLSFIYPQLVNRRRVKDVIVSNLGDIKKISMALSLPIGVVRLVIKEIALFNDLELDYEITSYRGRKLFDSSMNLKDRITDAAVKVLAHTKGNLSQAADILGVSQNELIYLTKDFTDEMFIECRAQILLSDNYLKELNVARIGVRTKESAAWLSGGNNKFIKNHCRFSFSSCMKNVSMRVLLMIEILTIAALNGNQMTLAEILTVVKGTDTSIQFKNLSVKDVRRCVDKRQYNRHSGYTSQRKRRQIQEEQMIEKITKGSYQFSARVRWGHSEPDDAAVDEALEWLGDLSELIKIPDYVVMEIRKILEALGYHEEAEYLKEIQRAGRLRRAPLMGVFKQLAGLVADKKEDGYWILIPKDISLPKHREHIITFVHEVVESFNRDKKRLTKYNAHKEAVEVELKADRINLDALKRRQRLSLGENVAAWTKGLRIYNLFSRNALKEGRNKESFGNCLDAKRFVKHAFDMGFNAIGFFSFCDTATKDPNKDDSPFALLSSLFIDPRTVDWDVVRSEINVLKVRFGFKGDTLEDIYSQFDQRLKEDNSLAYVYDRVRSRKYFQQICTVKTLRLFEDDQPRHLPCVSDKDFHALVNGFGHLEEEALMETEAYEHLFQMVLMTQFFAVVQVIDLVNYIHKLDMMAGYDQPFFKTMEGVAARYNPGIFARGDDGKILAAGYNLDAPEHERQYWGDAEKQQGLGFFNMKEMRRQKYEPFINPIEYFIAELGFDFVRGDAFHYAFGEKLLYQEISDLCHRYGAAFIPETLGCQNEKLVNGRCRRLGMLPIAVPFSWWWKRGDRKNWPKARCWKEFIADIVRKHGDINIWMPCPHDFKRAFRWYRKLFDDSVSPEARNKALYAIFGLALPNYALLFGDEFVERKSVNVPGTMHRWSRKTMLGEKHRYDICDHIKGINELRIKYPYLSEYGNIRNFAVLDNKVYFERYSMQWDILHVTIDLVTGEISAFETCLAVKEKIKFTRNVNPEIMELVEGFVDTAHQMYTKNKDKWASEFYKWYKGVKGDNFFRSAFILTLHILLFHPASEMHDGSAYIMSFPEFLGPVKGREINYLSDRSVMRVSLSDSASDNPASIVNKYDAVDTDQKRSWIINQLVAAVYHAQDEKSQRKTQLALREVLEIEEVDAVVWDSTHTISVVLDKKPIPAPRNKLVVTIDSRWLSGRFKVPWLRAKEAQGFIKWIVSLGFGSIWHKGGWAKSKFSYKLMQEFLKSNKEVGVKRWASAYDIFEYILDHLALGSEKDFRALSKKLRKQGIWSILDVVTNHMAADSPTVSTVPGLILSFPIEKFYEKAKKLVPGVSGLDNDQLDEWLKNPKCDFFRCCPDLKDPSKDIVVCKAWYGNHPDGSIPPRMRTLVQINYMDKRARRYMIEHVMEKTAYLTCDGGIRADLAFMALKLHVKEVWANQLGISASDFDTKMPREFWDEAMEYLKERHPGMLIFVESYEYKTEQEAKAYHGSRAKSFQDFGAITYIKYLYDLLRFDAIGNYRDYMKDVPYAFILNSLFFGENHDEPPAMEAFGSKKRMLAAMVIQGLAPGWLLITMRQIFNMGTPKKAEEKNGGHMAEDSPDAAIYVGKYPRWDDSKTNINKELVEIIKFFSRPIFNKGISYRAKHESLQIKRDNSWWQNIDLKYSALYAVAYNGRHDNALGVVNYRKTPLKVSFRLDDIFGNYDVDVKMKGSLQDICKTEKVKYWIDEERIVFELPAYGYALIHFGEKVSKVQELSNSRSNIKASQALMPFFRWIFDISLGNVLRFRWFRTPPKVVDVILTFLQTGLEHFIIVISIIEVIDHFNVGRLGAGVFGICWGIFFVLPHDKRFNRVLNMMIRKVFKNANLPQAPPLWASVVVGSSIAICVIITSFFFFLKPYLIITTTILHYAINFSVLIFVIWKQQGSLYKTSGEDARAKFLMNFKFNKLGEKISLDIKKGTSITLSEEELCKLVKELVYLHKYLPENLFGKIFKIGFRSMDDLEKVEDDRIWLSYAVSKNPTLINRGMYYHIFISHSLCTTEHEAQKHTIKNFYENEKVIEENEDLLPLTVSHLYETDKSNIYASHQWIEMLTGADSNILVKKRIKRALKKGGYLREKWGRGLKCVEIRNLGVPYIYHRIKNIETKSIEYGNKRVTVKYEHYFLDNKGDVKVTSLKSFTLTVTKDAINAELDVHTVDINKAVENAVGKAVNNEFISLIPHLREQDILVVDSVKRLIFKNRKGEKFVIIYKPFETVIFEKRIIEIFKKLGLPSYEIDDEEDDVGKFGWVENIEHLKFSDTQVKEKFKRAQYKQLAASINLDYFLGNADVLMQNMLLGIHEPNNCHLIDVELAMQQFSEDFETFFIERNKRFALEEKKGFFIKPFDSDLLHHFIHSTARMFVKGKALEALERMVKKYIIEATTEGEVRPGLWRREMLDHFSACVKHADELRGVFVYTSKKVDSDSFDFVKKRIDNFRKLMNCLPVSFHEAALENFSDLNNYLKNVSSFKKSGITYLDLKGAVEALYFYLNTKIDFIRVNDTKTRIEIGFDGKEKGVLITRVKGKFWHSEARPVSEFVLSDKSLGIDAVPSYKWVGFKSLSLYENFKVLKEKDGNLRGGYANVSILSALAAILIGLVAFGRLQSFAFIYGWQEILSEFCCLFLR